MKLETNQSVYVIFNPELNITKIGVSATVQNRLSALRCESGCDLQLVYHTDPIVAANIFEGRVHAILADKKKSGEWFRVDPQEAVAIVKDVVRDATIDTIVTDYLAGHTITFIANKMRVTRQAVISKLKTYGIYGGRYRRMRITGSEAASQTIEKKLVYLTASEVETWDDVLSPDVIKPTRALARVAQNIYFDDPMYKIRIYHPTRGWIEGCVDNIDRAKAYIEYIKNGGTPKY